MNKKEKEGRLEAHINYWELVDKLRDVSLEALDNVSVGDIISALDRIKVELLQQEVLVMIEEASTGGGEGEESEEGTVTPPQVDLQATMPLVDPAELSNALRRAVNN